jgi:hypothetical protein
MFAMLLLSGCSDLLSVQPLATAETTVFDAGLTGDWSCADEGRGDYSNLKGVALIRAGSAEKKEYDIVWLPDKGEALRLKGQLVKVGDRLVFDLIAVKETTLAVPAHFFMLVQKTGDGVKFHWLDSDWLRDRVMSKDALAHAMVDDKPVITAGSAEINAFLAKFGLDAQAGSGSLSLKRVKGQ